MSAPLTELTAVAVRSPLLERFHRAGVLDVADVHTAEALGRRLLERAGIATSSSATATGKTSASPPA